MNQAKDPGQNDNREDGANLKENVKNVDCSDDDEDFHDNLRYGNNDGNGEFESEDDVRDIKHTGKETHGGGITGEGNTSVENENKEKNGLPKPT